MAILSRAAKVCPVIPNRLRRGFCSSLSARFISVAVAVGIGTYGSGAFRVLTGGWRFLALFGSLSLKLRVMSIRVGRRNTAAAEKEIDVGGAERDNTQRAEYFFACFRIAVQPEQDETDGRQKKRCQNYYLSMIDTS